MNLTKRFRNLLKSNLSPHLTLKLRTDIFQEFEIKPIKRRAVYNSGGRSTVNLWYGVLNKILVFRNWTLGFRVLDFNGELCLSVRVMIGMRSYCSLWLRFIVPFDCFNMSKGIPIRNLWLDFHFMFIKVLIISVITAFNNKNINGQIKLMIFFYFSINTKRKYFINWCAAEINILAVSRKNIRECFFLVTCLMQCICR